MKTMYFFRPIALAGAIILGSSTALHASLTLVDQQNTSLVGETGLTVSDPNGTTNGGFGQSFTPTQATMNAATFQMYASNPSYTSTVQLYVYAGSGYSGTLLAKGPAVTIYSSQAETVELPLSSALTLTPGSKYTLRVYETAGYYDIYSGQNLYSGGNLFSTTGTSDITSDLGFQEGTDASLVVPEPGTWAGGALLLGATALTLRRRLQVA